MKHLKSSKPETKSKSVKSEIPSSRKEAKQELKRRMGAFKKEIDEAEAQKECSGESSATGSKKAVMFLEMKGQKRNRLDPRKIFLHWTALKMKVVRKLKIFMARCMASDHETLV